MNKHLYTHLNHYYIFRIGLALACMITALTLATPAHAQSIPFPWEPPRTSPFEPPEADDRTFVVDEGGPVNDTRWVGADAIMPSRFLTGDGTVMTNESRLCVERVRVGPTDIPIEVTRVVGKLNSEGTLADPEAMIQAGTIGRYAKIRMMTWDVDWTIAPGERLSGIAYTGEGIIAKGIRPERDRVLFNGVEIYRTGTSSPFLFGENNSFVLNEFDVPIEIVKFPVQGAIGEPPEPAVNTLTIEWDIDNIGNYVEHPFYEDPGLDNFWCALIDWVALSFQATSPVILIHGNNSEGAFFDRQGFTVALDVLEMPFDGCGRCPNHIDGNNLPTDRIVRNAHKLNTLIPGIITSFGVDSAHLVVHSKGGLDSRAFLADYYPSHTESFEILSYTSLSTPHNGSILADLSLNAYNGILNGRVEYQNFPRTIERMTSLMFLSPSSAPDQGQYNLTTTYLAGFNARNVPRLSPDIRYHTIAADMDANGNGYIDQRLEYQELLDEAGGFAPTLDRWTNIVRRNVIDTMYQVLRNTRQIRVDVYQEPSSLGGQRLVFVLTSIDNAEPLGNDGLVTLPSGQGVGTFGQLVSQSQVFQGGDHKNHSSVADAHVGATVIPWILDVETEQGDLRPLWTEAP